MDIVRVSKDVMLLRGNGDMDIMRGGKDVLLLRERGACL